MQIESVNNPKIKNLIKLKDKKYRDLTNSFIVEGCHLVREALKKNLVMEIYSLNDEDYGVPSFKVSEAVMKRVSTQVSISPVIALCKKMEEKDILGPTLILDGIQDPGNLGTIIRSAVAFSMPNIILSDDAVDLYNPKVVRATQGTLFHIPIFTYNFKELLPMLKELKIPIYATRVEYGTDAKELTVADKKRFALLVGNEGSGVRKEYLELSDKNLYIPMSNDVESLNVAIATSVLLYELGKKDE